MGAASDDTFFFLFRTDRGRIDSAVWWRGTLPLLVVAALLTGGWLLLRPYATQDLATSPSLGVATLAAYIYLVVFAFASVLIAICEYNLSAKRFRDRGRPAVLAAVLPLTLLGAGALIGFVPSSLGALPDWTETVVLAVVLAVAVWNVVDLGFGPTRSLPR